MTTEVVRLRGATQHNCRLCKSLRESNALDAGGSEDRCTAEIERLRDVDAADRPAQGGAAVCRRTDLVAVAIDPDVAAGVREHFSEAEALELTLDVMRNACNKIAVSLAADAPRVARAPSGI